MIALVAVRLSRRPPDAKRTYGYARLKALGALVNGGMLFVVAAYILWEAVQRFRQPQEVATVCMLGIAAFGLLINLISMRLLKAGSGESLNVKGAYLEVWSDMLGSVAVIAGALAIRLTGWKVIDPILAVLIGLWVLPRTWVLLREAVNVLLEGVPKGMDMAAVRGYLRGAPGVQDVQDLHVWALASSTPALTAHVVIADGADADALRAALCDGLHVRFDIDHITLQMESGHCGVQRCCTPARVAPGAHDGHAHTITTSTTAMRTARMGIRIRELTCCRGPEARSGQAIQIGMRDRAVEPIRSGFDSACHSRAEDSCKRCYNSAT